MDAPLRHRIEDKVQGLFGSGTAVVSIEGLAGDASSRRYHRAVLDPSCEPRSLIVMEWSDPGLPISSEELAVFEKPPEELPFLNVHRFLSGVGVRVPRVYGHWQHEGLLLLEDLGDVSLWDRVQGLTAAEALGWYQKAIAELLKFQICGTRARDASCIAFQQSFDRRLYTWEFQHFIEYGLYRGSKQKLPPPVEHALAEAFEAITARLTALPQVLSHRDYHSWNLMVPDDEVVVIDFQDALLAPAAYDLASLLNDRETDTVVDSELEQQLVSFYLKTRESLGEAPVREELFWETYLLSVLQRDLKVVGRFVYLDLVKGKPGYRRFLPATVRRIARTVERVPWLAPLGPVLNPQLEDLA